MSAQARAVVQEISQENQPGNAVVEHLQTEVANASLLYFNYKHYHWQTFGPLFRDLHLLFDDMAKEAIESIDEFAERIRMIGQDPMFDPRRMHERACVQPARTGGSMRDMVQEANQNLFCVIKGMREGARIADDQNDPGTVDLFSRMVQIHEKHEWFLRQILKKGDGLSS